jgi:hypothetical protein
LPAAGQKNRAFRFKSSDLHKQILWAFRFNPLRRAASEFANANLRASQDAWASSKIAYAILRPAPMRRPAAKKAIQADLKNREAILQVFFQ